MPWSNFSPFALLCHICFRISPIKANFDFMTLIITFFRSLSLLLMLLYYKFYTPALWSFTIPFIYNKAFQEVKTNSICSTYIREGTTVKFFVIPQRRHVMTLLNIWDAFYFPKTFPASHVYIFRINFSKSTPKRVALFMKIFKGIFRTVSNI